MAERRIRRHRVYRLERRRHMHRKKIGLFDIIGLSMGLGLSAFGPNGSDFKYFKEDPIGQTKYALNGIVAGITGYDMIKKDWKPGNLGEFWVPFVSFHVVNWALKKLGFNHIRIFRNINLA